MHRRLHRSALSHRIRQCALVVATLLSTSAASAQDMFTAEGNRLLNYATSVRNEAARTGLEAAQASDRGDYVSACTLFTKSVEQWGDAERALVNAIQPAYMVGQSREVDAMVDDRIADNKRGLNAALSDKSAACGSHSSASSSSSGSSGGSYTPAPPPFDFNGALRALQVTVNSGNQFANNAVAYYTQGRKADACTAAKSSSAAYAKAKIDARDILGRQNYVHYINIYKIDANAKQAAADETEFYCAP
jgi:hypothetical protein